MDTKKQLSLATVGAGFIALVIGGAAQAAVLGTEDFTVNGGISDIFKEFKPTLAIGPAVTEPGPAASAPATNAPLFTGTSITPNDVGQTFTATQYTDPNFKDFTTFLTDGKPDKITLSFGSGSLNKARLFSSKSGALFGGNLVVNGNTINSIALRINSLTLDTPGINPNGDGNWTDYSFNGTFIVNGKPVADASLALSVYGKSVAYPSSKPVPEPTSALNVLVVGAFGSGLLLKRKQQQVRSEE